MERPSMGRMPIATYLWPGLPMILANGSWWGLAWAGGFAALANLLIVAGLWWPELFQTHIRNGLWLATAVFWVGAMFVSARGMRQFRPIVERENEVTFADATRHYLRGDWYAVERVLLELIGRNCRDVDSGLMLATVWRHTGRFGEALQQLKRLELLEESHKWGLEIYQEKKRLESVGREAEAMAENTVEVEKAA